MGLSQIGQGRCLPLLTNHKALYLGIVCSMVSVKIVTPDHFLKALQTILQNLMLDGVTVGSLPYALPPIPTKT